MRLEDEERLRHMLDAAREAISFVKGRKRTDLENDRQLALALVKEIEIIGEAANRMSESAKSEIPLIPWREIVGMRHRLIHAYFGVDQDILWDTVAVNLPPLINVLEATLNPRN